MEKKPECHNPVHPNHPEHHLLLAVQNLLYPTGVDLDLVDPNGVEGGGLVENVKLKREDPKIADHKEVGELRMFMNDAAPILGGGEERSKIHPSIQSLSAVVVLGVITTVVGGERLIPPEEGGEGREPVDVPPDKGGVVHHLLGWGPIDKPVKVVDRIEVGQQKEGDEQEVIHPPKKEEEEVDILPVQPPPPSDHPPLHPVQPEKKAGSHRPAGVGPLPSPDPGSNQLVEPTGPVVGGGDRVVEVEKARKPSKPANGGREEVDGESNPAIPHQPHQEKE